MCELSTAFAIRTMSCGVACSTHCRSVLRWVAQIHAPTVALGFRSARAWSTYGCTTYCRPPHPLRVGAYLKAAVCCSAGLLSRWHSQGYNRLHAEPAHSQRTRCEPHFCLLRDCRNCRNNVRDSHVRNACDSEDRTCLNDAPAILRSTAPILQRNALAYDTPRATTAVRKGCMV